MHATITMVEQKQSMLTGHKNKYVMIYGSELCTFSHGDKTVYVSA
jgi:hypothetical protein